MFSFLQKKDPLAEASACFQRGVDFLKQNNIGQSLAELQQAVDLDPGNARYFNSLGTTRKAAGDLTGAGSSYRKAVELDPAYTAPLYNLALLLRESGQLQEAEQCFRRLHALDPKDADALFHLGYLLAARSEFGEAIQMYEKSLQLTPDNPHLWLYLGYAYHDIPDRLEEAVRCLQKCIALQPELIDAHVRLGVIFNQLSRLDEAMQCYRTAIKLDSNQPQAHYSLADILSAAGKWSDAIASYRETVRLAPDFVAAYGNLGAALVQQGEFRGAINYFQHAIALQPDAVIQYFNLGCAYGALREHALAQRAFEDALRIDPGNVMVSNRLLSEMQQTCDWSRFDDLVKSCRDSIDTHTDQPTVPFALLSMPLTAAELLRGSKVYARHQFRAAAHARRESDFHFERKARTRIKIGYLSADFRGHALAHLLSELIELHDRTRFEVAAYSLGADDSSAARKRLRNAFDSFVDIQSLAYTAAAEKIFGDEVDILVDLMAYTRGARTEIFAMRPAPVQVNYLGYPGTMGTDFMDYIISDYIITPAEDAQHYAEKLVLMPSSYQVNDRKRPIAHTPTRAALGLPESAFVFCCFNRNFKILPAVFAAWMRLLQNAPDGILWLVQSNTWTADNLRHEATRHGVNPDRLIFAPPIPLDRHLARLRAADLFLDTSPYGAHTTASDALWMGLPVITCAGETFASRVAASLLHAAGLPELITSTMDDYVNLALRLVQCPAELAAVKEKLAGNHMTAPLFDTPAYARNLETAYQKMWENYISGNGPQSIYL